MTQNRRTAEVMRVFERYLVEVVERYELCPWARGTRERGELATAVLWGVPADAEWREAADELLARPVTRVAIVLAPELSASRAELAAARDRIAEAMTSAGVAEFHPDALLDLSTPGRLVPFVRRAPDPMLQLVPLTLLDEVRAAPPVATRAAQAEILTGRAAPPRPDTAERIARANHARVSAVHTEIAAIFDDIAADRRRSYAAAGINTSR
ncbi:MAG: hypothetical protein AB7R00_02765 [Kofleriaceae bacterium]